MKKMFLLGLLLVLAAQAVSAQSISWNATGSLNANGSLSSGSFNLGAKVVGFSMTDWVDYINFTRNGSFVRKESGQPFFMCGDTNGAWYDCRSMYAGTNWSASWNITAVVWKAGKVNFTESFIINPALQSNGSINTTPQGNETTNQTNQTNQTNMTAVSCGRGGLCINGTKFIYDGKLTHDGTPINGSLQIIRVANGLFDTQVNATFFDDYPLVCDREQFDNGADFGKWNATQNTQRLANAIPYYASKGVLGYSVSFQGGCSCSRGISGGFQWPDNNPFHNTSNGSVYIEQAYLDRFDTIVDAARAVNGTVIANLMYFGQEHRFPNTTERIELARVFANYLVDNNVTNVLIEVGNERSPSNTSFGWDVYAGMVDAVHEVSAQRNFTLYASWSLGFHVLPTAEYIGKVDFVDLHTSGTGSFAAPWTVTYMVNSTRTLMASMNVSKPTIIGEDDMVDNTNNLDESASLGLGWGYYNSAEKQSVPANFQAYSTRDFAYFGRTAQIAGVS